MSLDEFHYRHSLNTAVYISIPSFFPSLHPYLRAYPVPTICKAE